VDYEQIIENLSPDIYRSLTRALALGRWPDGRPMSPEQRRNAMQAVIAWGEKHLPEEQRVGYIDRGDKAGDSCDDPLETTLKWQE
jgi:hypothetical protein